VLILKIIGFAIAGLIVFCIVVAPFWRECKKCGRWTAIRYPILALVGTDELPQVFRNKCLRLIRCGHKWEEVLT